MKLESFGAHRASGLLTRFEVDDFLDGGTITGVREGLAEDRIADEIAHLRLIVVVVEEPGGAGAVAAIPEGDIELALFLRGFEGGDIGKIDRGESRVEVVDTTLGNFEEKNLRILHVDVRDAVDIGKLVACFIDDPVVGIARPDGVLAFGVGLKHPASHGGRARSDSEVPFLSIGVDPVAFRVDFLVVLRMELHQVVLGVHPAGADPALDPHGKAIASERSRSIVGDDKSGGIGGRKLPESTGAGMGFIGRNEFESGFQDFVVPPEENVFRAPGVTIGPLEAFAEMEGPFALVFVGFPAFDEARTNGEAIPLPAEERVAVHAFLNVVASTPVGRVRASTCQMAAIFADGRPWEGDDQWMLWKTLLDRWKLASLD